MLGMLEAQDGAWRVVLRDREVDRRAAEEVFHDPFLIGELSSSVGRLLISTAIDLVPSQDYDLQISF